MLKMAIRFLFMVSLTSGLSACFTSSTISNFSSSVSAISKKSNTLEQTALQTFASSSGFEINWTDRRPIGMIFLAPVDGNGAVNDGFGSANPRGWFNDRSISISNSAGLTQLQARILAYADSTIAVLEAMNAQGGIIWDAEGEMYPQDTTYLGDPTKAESVAPEWDSIVSGTHTSYDGMLLIDAYFKKYRDAGLRLGLTLRPQTLEFGDTNDCSNSGDVNHVCQPFSIETGTQEQAMQNKINFAKSRWGVSIFYVDSNVLADQYWRCVPSECNNDWTQCPATCPSGNRMLLSNGKSRMGGLPFDASVFSTLAEANPDSLVIPEHHWGYADGSHGDYFKNVSPLYQLFQDYGSNPAHTPDDEYSAVPGAFSAIIINNAGMTQGDARYNQLVAGVNRGDILLARAMFTEPDQDLVRSIYSQAATLTAIPRVIPGSAIQLLSASANSAVVSWSTNDAMSSQVNYGLSASYSNSTAVDKTLVKNHSVTLTGLAPRTTYHFSVSSTDTHANTGLSQDYTLTTAATTAPTATPSSTPSSSQLANSVNDFGSAQGQNQWSYGQYSASGTFSYSTLAWMGSSWLGTDSFGTPNIAATTQHPGCGSSGTNGLPTVRRWTNSSYSGMATVSGAISKNNTTCGDGTLDQVIVNGVTKYSVSLAANDGAGSAYSFTYAANPGDTVDMVTSPEGDCYCDATNFTMNVTTSASTPSPTPFPTPQIVANSVKDFGSSEGQNFWSYGQYSDSNSFSYSTLAWTGTSWLGTDSWGTPNIDASSQHPGCGTSGSNGLPTVRRWTNPAYSGTIVVSGTISKSNTSCGDGTSNAVIVNGVQKYAVALGYNDGVGSSYSFSYVAAPGDTIDMVTAQQGNCYCDSTNFNLTASYQP